MPRKSKANENTDAPEPPAMLADAVESQARETEEERAARLEKLYSWMPGDHAESCPRHRDFPKSKLNDIARKIFNLSPDADVTHNHRARIPCAERDGCVPADIIINSGTSSFLVGQESLTASTGDSPRIDPGDRRQGPAYVALLSLELPHSLCRLRDLPQSQAERLERERKQRKGLIPQDWELKARAKAPKGSEPVTLTHEQQVKLVREMTGA